MRLNLREILHVPGASLPFHFTSDLSELDFYGQKPFPAPVRATGVVRNMAGALVLEGEAAAVMDLTCDRCLKAFSREIRVPINTLMAETLENEESDEIVLLEDGEADLGEVFTTALVLGMDAKHLCREDCKGLCPRCGANLNDGPCSCKPEPDPRLAALAQLLDKKED